MGTIAQDLLAMGRSDAVKEVTSSSAFLSMDSYYVVDYSKLDIEFVEIIQPNTNAPMTTTMSFSHEN